MRTIRKFRSGFSLVSAIMLLVVIAALGVFAVTISTTQQQGSALDVLGARAYRAARAGVEWGAFQVLENNANGFAASCRAGSASQAMPALPNTLSGFAINVQCTATSRDEGERTAAGGNPLWVYRLTSTASQGTQATPGYVERQITVAIWN